MCGGLMIRHLSLIAAIILLTICWAFTLWILLNPPKMQRSGESLRYHGADMITTSWNGELVAYKWEKGTYILMWKRKQI